VRPARGRHGPWPALGLVGGVAVLGPTSALAEQARADARGLANEVTVLAVSAAGQVLVMALLWLALSYAIRPVAVSWTALTLLVSLFLLSRLAVAAEELNAALWERRHPDSRASS
jgi:hypothetical protein